MVDGDVALILDSSLSQAKFLQATPDDAKAAIPTVLKQNRPFAPSPDTKPSFVSVYSTKEWKDLYKTAYQNTYVPSVCPAPNAFYSANNMEMAYGQEAESNSSVPGEPSNSNVNKMENTDLKPAQPITCNSENSAKTGLGTPV